jgi:hypothetical protein
MGPLGFAAQRATREQWNDEQRALGPLGFVEQRASIQQHGDKVSKTCLCWRKC